MQGCECSKCSKGMSKSEMGLLKPRSGWMGTGMEWGRLGRVGHTEFQERNQGSKLEWRIEK